MVTCGYIRIGHAMLIIFFIGMLPSCSKSKAPKTDYNISVFAENIGSPALGLTFDSKGNLYVAPYVQDQSHQQIIKISPDGKDSIFAILECTIIQSVKAGPGDTIYVAAIFDKEAGTAGVFRVSQDSTISLVSDGFTQPVGIEFDAKPNLYVVDAMQKKVFKLNPSGEKSGFIDLTIDQGVPDNYYHSIDFDSAFKNFYIAGLNSKGTGNILKYEINDNGVPGNFDIISDRKSKHLVVRNNILYATVDNDGLLIVYENGSQELINDPLLNNGGYISFGRSVSGENTLYISTADKIVKVILNINPQ